MKFLNTVFTLFIFCASVACAQKKPNILVVVTDDLGYSDMSFLPYASKDVNTPNIDRIAKDGAFFTNAYATAPICSPARVGLLTGRYHQRWGNYWFGEGGLPSEEKTLPQLLKAQGYFNVKVGKTHLNGGPVEHPLDHGFDEFLGFVDHTWDYLRLSQEAADDYGEKNAEKAHIGPLLNGREKKSYKNGYTTDIFTDKTIDVIRNTTDKPFYIQLSYNAVHHPTYVGHPDYLKKYGIEQFPFWDPKIENYQSWHRKWGHLGKVDPDGRKRYLLQLEVMDKGIGKILDELEDSGKLDNTIIFFISDNGGTINTYAQNNPLNGYKYMFGEGGVRVPLIVSYPQRIKEKRTVNQMVSGMDLLPTIMEAIGAPIPNNLDGKSLWPTIENNISIHDKLVWSNGRDSWVVRKGKWRLAHNIGWVHNTYELEGGVALPASDEYQYPDGIQLFDLENDISETKNLKDKYPEIVAELTNVYKKWQQEMSDPRTSDGVLKTKNDSGKFIGNSLIEDGAEIYSDGAEKDNFNSAVIDGYEKTYWKSPGGDSGKPLPHFIAIDFQKKKTFSQIKYVPAPDKVKGRVSDLKIYVSNNQNNWGSPVKTVSFPNDAKPSLIKLDQKVSARYMKLEAVQVHDSSQQAAIAEIDIIN
ncbi:sulfatase-like hydrolase/transferase [Tamlana sp. I1]|uniref:sulfatase-like hydrolase/transferase n=1 Tax=Tamlana sp. I1 TaxID=2762061 RepID=UPI0018903B90|nr:sulfatase-like hydrolase/transferase [Tamlana sp. I1]